MGKSKDKRSSASPPAGSINESNSQPSSGFPPRTFSNMAAPAPLSSQGGLGFFSLIEGCTRFPSAIDKEGVNNPPDFCTVSVSTLCMHIELAHVVASVSDAIVRSVIFFLC